MSRLVTPFGFHSTTSDVLAGVDLSGKTAVVTGANAGIGYETARALAGAGAAVVVAARRGQAGRDAAARIAASTGNPHVSPILLDLADLESATRVAAGWSGPLHILVNNAGIMAVPELTRSAQGHELQFATNYLGHFALTTGLRPALAAAGGARIVSLSSSAHLHSPVVFGDLDFRFRPYDPRQAYAESKTATVLLAVGATRRWASEGIHANAVNPGAIATGLQKHTGGLKTPPERRKSVEQGAATSVFLAASPLAEGIGGRYFEDVSEAGTRTESPGLFGTGVADYALDPRYAELLWEVSAEMIGGVTGFDALVIGSLWAEWEWAGPSAWSVPGSPVSVIGGPQESSMLLWYVPAPDEALLISGQGAATRTQSSASSPGVAASYGLLSTRPGFVPLRSGRRDDRTRAARIRVLRLPVGRDR